MRHHVKNRKFGRVRSQRKALLRDLARALILEERIETTEARAKELRPFVEKLITKSKNPNTATKRRIAAYFNNSAIVVARLIDVLGPKYKDRDGGYTRITKLPQRDSDSAKMAVIELVE